MSVFCLIYLFSQEMEEIERQLEMEIARLHEAEASDHVTQPSDHVMQSSDHVTQATDHVMLDHVPTKQTAGHMDPVKLPKEVSSQPINTNLPVPSASASTGPSMDSAFPGHPVPKEAWGTVSTQEPFNSVYEQRSVGHRIASNGMTMSEQDVYLKNSNFSHEQRLQNSEQSVGREAAMGQSNFYISDRDQSVHSARGVSGGVPDVMRMRGGFQLGGLDERLMANGQDVGSLLSESTEFFRVVHPTMPVDSTQSVRPPAAHDLKLSSGSRIGEHGQSLNGMQEQPKPFVQSSEQRYRVQHGVDNAHLIRPQTGAFGGSTDPALSFPVQSFPDSVSSINRIGQSSSLLAASMPVSTAFTGMRPGQSALTNPPVLSTQQRAPVMSIGQPIAQPSITLAAPTTHIPSTTASVLSRVDSSSTTFTAYPGLSQIHTPQPQRARGTSFRRAMPGPQSISTPLQRSSALLVPPPIQTPLAMRQGSLLTQPTMQKSAVVEQSHQRNAMIVSPVALHLQRDGHLSMQSVVSTAPSTAASQELRSHYSQAIPAMSASSALQPNTLLQSSIRHGTSQPTFGLPVGSTVPSVVPTQAPMNHHPHAIPPMSSSSSLHSTVHMQPSIYPGTSQPSSNLHVSTTDSTFQPRPSHTIQDSNTGQPNPMIPQRSDVQGSLALANNLGRPAAVHPSTRQQVNREKGKTLGILNLPIPFLKEF